MALVFDTSGLTIETYEEIVEALGDAQQAMSELGATWVTSPDSPQGQLNAVFADALRQLQEALLALYQAMDRSSATGQLLVNLSLITGTEKRFATPATVTATVNLNAGVTLLAGSQANVDGDTDIVFATDEDVTNTGGSPANVDVEMSAVIAGSAAFAAAGTLTEITTPVAGWNSVTNAEDSVSGLDDETDPELRQRGLRELSSRGSANIDAIVAAVSAVTGVTDLQGYENTDDDTNGDGLPGNSLEIVVLGGDDDEIAQAIWDSKPAGILSYGADDGEAIDASNHIQTVRFSRPTNVNIYLTFANMDTDTSYVGDTAFKADLVQAAEEFFEVGDDVLFTRVISLAYGIQGVRNFDLTLGIAASPTLTTDITIGVRQLASFDTTRVAVS